MSKKLHDQRPEGKTKLTIDDASEGHEDGEVTNFLLSR